MSVFHIGEKIHVIEKRIFVDDVRRHFVGVVKSFSENAIRIIGYVWVYNVTKAKFIRRSELRERVLILGDRIIINILPNDVDIQDVVYNTDDLNRMLLTNNKDFNLDLSEFIPM